VGGPELQFLGHSTVRVELAGRGFLVHPRGCAPPGEVVGAEELHRVFRGWLSDLGHPEPTGEGATVGPDSITALRERWVAEPIGESAR
jgi:hypothetical protein